MMGDGCKAVVGRMPGSGQTNLCLESSLWC